MNSLMNRTVVTLFRLGLVGFVAVGCTRESDSLDPAFKRFVKNKQTQARTIATQQNLKMPALGWKIFGAILADDYSKATNLFARAQSMRMGIVIASPFQNAMNWSKERFEKLGLYSPKASALQSAAWQPLVETYWAYVLQKTCHKPFLETFIQDTLSVIPSNSIYFGGTDPGRFAITSAMNLHSDGRPFFVLTQNQLADGDYREYVELMYGKQLHVPNSGDAQKVFSNYLADEQLSGQTNQSVGGISAVVRLNVRFVNHIFEQNPDREFYVEQSWPMRWTYPHLVPKGPILKLSRKPLGRISEMEVEADRKYWSQLCARLIGDWINDATPPKDVCDFVERVYLRRDLNGFTGDSHYVATRREQEMFAKLRYSVADVYWWRVVESKEVVEKERMSRECMISFLQAFALGPCNVEVVQYFAYYLNTVRRYDEAIRVLEIGLTFNPDDEDLKSKMKEIKANAITADGKLN